MKDHPASDLGYMLGRASRSMDNGIKAIIAAAGLSVEEWRVLILLDERGGQTMTALAREAFLELSRLTKMIDRLVSDALVYRTPDVQDRRRVMVHISDKGGRCVAALQPAIRKRQRSISARVSAAELTSLKGILARLANDDDASEADDFPQHCAIEPGRP